MTEKNHIDPEQVSRSVLARKLIRFWDWMTGLIFPHPARQYVVGETIDTYSIALPSYVTFFERYSRYGATKGLVCTVTHAEEDLDIARIGLTIIEEGVQDQEVKDFLTADFCGKLLSYRDLKEGAHFSLLGETFTVDTVFDLWKGFSAFGLRGKRSAILLYRGTDLSPLTQAGRASMISDLDPQGPGVSLFHEGKHSIEGWLYVQKKDGKELRAFGHSLGGSLVCYTLIEYPHLFSQKLPSYASHYPGINKASLARWETIEQKPAVIPYVVEGDGISKCGQLLPETVVITHEKKITPMKAHELLIGAEGMFSLSKIALNEENYSRTRRIITKMHQSIGALLHAIGLKKFMPHGDNKK